MDRTRQDDFGGTTTKVAINQHVLGHRGLDPCRAVRPVRHSGRRPLRAPQPRAPRRRAARTMGHRPDHDPHRLDDSLPSRLPEMYADQRFNLRRDVIYEALEQLIVSCGHSPTRNELLHREQLLWTAAVPTATPADGANETLTRLRGAGIRTAIVSYADTAVFEALLKQTRLAGLTDAEMCSEVARSCKPHPEILHHALRTIGVDPSAAMFVATTPMPTSSAATTQPQKPRRSPRRRNRTSAPPDRKW